MIIVIWGTEGLGKSTMGLTFPKPLKHYDLDVGGYERAAWRMDVTEVTSKRYPIPIQIEKMTGLVSTRFPRRVIGYKEVWQQIVVDFVADCQNADVKSIMLDSATMLWSICHQSLLQEKQEIQLAGGMKVEDTKFRERLQPVEFPNDRMRSLIYTARSYGKHLILTHYPRNVYKEKFDKHGELVSYKSEDIEPDGFRDTKKLVDIVVWTYSDKGEPRARIDLKCALPGLGMGAVGLELPNPSYEGILELQKAMQGE